MVPDTSTAHCSDWHQGSHVAAIHYSNVFQSDCDGKNMEYINFMTKRHKFIKSIYVARHPEICPDVQIFYKKQTVYIVVVSNLGVSYLLQHSVPIIIFSCQSLCSLLHTNATLDYENDQSSKTEESWNQWNEKQGQYISCLISHLRRNREREREIGNFFFLLMSLLKQLQYPLKSCWNEN